VVPVNSEEQVGMPAEPVGAAPESAGISRGHGGGEIGFHPVCAVIAAGTGPNVQGLSAPTIAGRAQA
jgi:hypothetical protein